MTPRTWSSRFFEVTKEWIQSSFRLRFHMIFEKVHNVEQVFDIDGAFLVQEHWYLARVAIDDVLREAKIWDTGAQG